MNTIPQELNWVEKRSSCTVGRVFNQICDGVIKDVEIFNSVRQLDYASQFREDMHSSGRSIFVAQPNQVPRLRLAIGVVQERIVIKEESTQQTWGVAIGLNDEGCCTLRLEDGTELEQWQFRKKALEGLFFGDKP